MTILSTKTLTPSQRNLVLAAGNISLVQYDAIKIQFIDFEMPDEVKNAIFTSQNTVKAIHNSEFIIQNCYCVGQKTTSLLKNSGINVIKTTEYGSELGRYIAENHKNEKFYFFCGNKRREEMPAILTEAGVDFEEVMVYNNELSPKRFEQAFDAILFYSPSGVQSFAEKNGFGESLAVCIGKTTAAEVKTHTKNIKIANATTVESVIAKAVIALRKG